MRIWGKCLQDFFFQAHLQKASEVHLICNDISRFHFCIIRSNAADNYFDCPSIPYETYVLRSFRWLIYLKNQSITFPKSRRVCHKVQHTPRLV